MPKKLITRPSKQITIQPLDRRIYVIRGHRVMLDFDLASLYGVPAKVLNQAVKRNLDRFPDDFMFRLTNEEAAALRSQFVTLDKGRGRYPKYSPFTFTEHGVAMLSSVLRSKRAVQVNILIVRAFIRMREMLATHKDLATRMERLEATQKRHGSVISILAEEIQEMKRLPEPPKRRMGFRADVR
ncbi:MAG: ORF6N domain-containing protein [Limisphaerales bacterium]